MRSAGGNTTRAILFPIVLPIFLGLLLATLLAYQPAWHGGLLWDDDGHLTRSDLRSPSGFARIWLDLGATQQYYPVVHSAFWLFYHLWGDQTLGYHLVNIALHAFSAYLLFLVLERLSIRGAALAAALFALHPVHVESVAWITELKNVMSGAFYLAAALAYIRYDGTGRRTHYALALGLFVMAVLSKSVTVTLPVALLIVQWWRRGRLSLRGDIAPLLPFFAIGVAAGLLTVWFERTLIGAEGAEFSLSFAERCLIAGRALWFYLGKLVWPAHLVFIYPRWTIDSTALWQWAYPVAAVAGLAAAWLARHRSRAPLASLLFFCVTLFPALGFFNVYPFRFSFVADHFQYLASIGPVAALSAAAVWTALKVNPGVRLTAAAILLVMLGGLTFAQARQYGSADALYRATIARNPSAWLARNNLATLLLQGEPPGEHVREALRHLEAALELKPDYAEAHYNLGTAFERLGRPDDAIARYQRVLELKAGQRMALERLAAILRDRGSALIQQGRSADAVPHLTLAVKLTPQSADANYSLALALESLGRIHEAERHYRIAAVNDPTRSAFHRGLGRALQRLQKREDAIVAYREALALDDRQSGVHNDLGVVLAQLGRMAEAADHFARAVQLDPSDQDARENLSRARAAVGR